jgi:hypothetical protein
VLSPSSDIDARNASMPVSEELRSLTARLGLCFSLRHIECLHACLERIWRPKFRASTQIGAQLAATAVRCSASEAARSTVTWSSVLHGTSVIDERAGRCKANGGRNGKGTSRRSPLECPCRRALIPSSRRAEGEWSLENELVGLAEAWEWWRLGLLANPAEGLAPFDTSQHPVYTFEEPNSLTVEELRTFLRCMCDNFPGHYAMTFWGFALGKRPSTTRPLRRTGPTPDIHWDTGVLLFRRSNTQRQIVMEGVKTGGEERVQAPAELLAVLRWHVETSSVTSPASVRLAVSGAPWRLPYAQRPEQALPGGGSGNRTRQTHHASGHAPHVPGPLPRSGGRRPGHPFDQRACDGGHAAPLQHGAPEEQRRGLSNVIQLMHPSAATLHGGEGPRVSGKDPNGGRC